MDTHKSIDIMLYMIAAGTLTGAMLVAPNAVQLLDKPLNMLFNKLDMREKQRKLSQLKSYMKTQGLVVGDYDHGIQLSNKAKQRLAKVNFENVRIKIPEVWNKNWHLVIFDIPEQRRTERVQFTNKIQSLGFQLLQRSVWIHPFACREEIMTISSYYKVNHWVTYLETSHIDQQDKLITRFKSIL